MALTTFQELIPELPSAVEEALYELIGREFTERLVAAVQNRHHYSPVSVDGVAPLSMVGAPGQHGIRFFINGVLHQVQVVQVPTPQAVEAAAVPVAA